MVYLKKDFTFEEFPFSYWSLVCHLVLALRTTGLRTKIGFRYIFEKPFGSHFFNQTSRRRTPSFDGFSTLNSRISKTNKKKEICHEKQNLLQKAKRNKTVVKFLPFLPVIPGVGSSSAYFFLQKIIWTNCNYIKTVQNTLLQKPACKIGNLLSF